ncbi:MAG: 50S ribosomal protein L21 [Candidatus Yanofskybacteria bacterium]|nr:50S ribosomal protein L21 [Candidatus Yanofskybacteria bacterium]
MFAVIKTGGKQYKVAEGDVLEIEKLKIKSEKLEFKEVLLVVNPSTLLGAGGEVKLGKPVVSGAKVTAKVLEEGKGDKKIVFRFRSKTRQHKKKGHRQPYTKVQILKIEG